MRIRKPFFLTTAMSVFLLGQSGCDYLPETITGQPSPEAKPVMAVGPSSDRQLYDYDPPTMADLEQAESSQFPTPVEGATHLEGNHVQGESSGDSFVNRSGQDAMNLRPAFSANAFGSEEVGNTAESTPVRQSNIYATSSQRNERPVDGKIIIPVAHLKFVHNLDMAATADGLVTSITVDEGDVVRKDSPLFQLDDRLANSELQITRKEYQAALEKAQDESEIQYSEAARSVAKEDYEIAKRVNAAGADTVGEFNKKWLEYKRADLAITVAKVKNNQDRASSEVTEAKVGAAEVQVELRKINAPFDGVVAERRKEQYDWVRAGDVILRLISMEQLRVIGQVRVAHLQDAPHTLLGKPATVDIELYPGKTVRVEGRVGFVSPVMESSDGYKIWIQIANQKSDDQWLFREGMPARIEIATR